MNSPTAQFSTFVDTKRHYDILDGLRGVAAIMVVAFHLFETHTIGRFDQFMNHGYLAVDFFYVLSGFVIGYAYDDRWGKMTLGGFFKRRLIRLHPMIVIGMLIGALNFYFQESPLWPLIHDLAVWKLLFIMLIGFTLIPIPISMDIRGWSETYPLDGPAWSLFFEYLANILYGLFIRKFSNWLLSLLVFISGCALIQLAVTHGDLIGGWSLDSTHLQIGFTRLMFPFFAGLLLSRIIKLHHIKHSFLICSTMLILIFSIPRIGGEELVWMNGLYDSLCIIFIFPLIVYLGAGGAITGSISTKICKFLGDISYPIYITHYPLIYTYTAWISNTKKPLAEAWPVALLVFVSAILISYACLKLYDEPVREWLSKRFMTKQSANK